MKQSDIFEMEDEDSTDDENVREKIVSFSSYIFGGKGNIKTTDSSSENFQFSIQCFDSGKVVIREYRTNRICNFNMPSVVKLTKIFELGNDLAVAFVDMRDILYISLIRFTTTVFQLGPRKEIELKNQLSPVFSIEVCTHHPSRSLIIVLGHFNFFVSTLVGTVCKNSCQGIQEVDILSLQNLGSASLFHMMFCFSHIFSNEELSKRANEEIIKRMLSPVMRICFLLPMPSQPLPIMILACQLFPNLILLTSLKVLPPPSQQPDQQFIAQKRVGSVVSLVIEGIEMIPLRYLEKCLYMNVVHFQRRPSNMNSGVINLIVCSGREGIEILIPSSHVVRGQEKCCRRIFIEGNPKRPIQQTILVQCVSNRVLEYVLIFAIDDQGVSWGYQLKWDDIVSGNDDVSGYLNENFDDRPNNDTQKRKSSNLDLMNDESNNSSNNNNFGIRMKKKKLKKLKRGVARRRVAGMMFVDGKQTVMYLDEFNRELFSS